MVTLYSSHSRLRSTIALLMRRVPATVLLVLLCLGFAWPILQAQGSGVPACCRSWGKHHCTMSPGSDGFRSVSRNCSYRRWTLCKSHSNGIRNALVIIGVDV